MGSIQGYGFPTEQNNSLQENTPEFVSLSVNQVASNSSLSQLLQKMQAIKATISNLTLTNQNLATTNNNQNFNAENLISPKNELPWKRYCWSCGCCTHWSRHCPNKKGTYR